MKKKNIIKYNNILAIDIGGATRMGIAAYNLNDKKLLDYATIRRKDVKDNLSHRMALVDKIKEFHNEYNTDLLLFESIRLFSYGRIQLPTILSLNKVQTTIINEFSDTFDIYQIDVRAWKSRVLGTANADKHASLAFVRHKYPEIDLLDEIVKPKKGETIFELNHDLADSIAIAHCLNLDYSILQDKNKLNYK